ncbi:MAG: tetratricopeptide repeat protein [Bacteroidales bacterium]|nr:tetratricopeptide repeat protein [Bacteroidales bacterium]
MAKQQNETTSKIKLVSLASILFVTILIFSGSIKNDILYGWDDGEYIENTSIQNLDAGEFFTSYYLGMYQPLAVLSLSLNYKTAELNPAAYHMTNLAIHLINISLVFLLFFKFSKRVEIAMIVSFLFAIHPMHVEAVAWIATRSNGLYSMFFLAALYLYLIYLERDKINHLLLTFVLFGLSCLSKSMAITLPFILLLIDFYKGRKFDRKVILEKIPFFIVSIIIGIVTINAASDFGHIKNLDVSYNIIDRVVLFIYAIVFYIIKAIAPANLSAVYAYPEKTGGFFLWEYYFALILFGIIIFAILRSAKFKKDILFGASFFIITIFPVLPIIWSRMLMLADRYTYIPYLGLFFILSHFYISFTENKNVKVRKYKNSVYLALIAYSLFLIITTYQRNEIWRNAINMITDVIEKDRSDVDVSIGYFFRGNIHDLNRDYEGALRDFSKAIELNPDYTMAYNNRGIIKGSTGDFRGALDDFNEAVSLEPGYADAIYNRGNAYYYLEQPDKACADWNEATKLGSAQAKIIFEKYCR